VPYHRGDVLASVHREGEVVHVGAGDDAWLVEARLSEASVGRLEEFLVPVAVSARAPDGSTP
jgi:GTP-binding protein HflX